ncbi:hypothetical protein DPMN_114759 [Dreissena polymorpha]|uniref:Uncharacterized protein n=1 Tax=Dreissena polymorpha TaxID=45954 RepID=A0A9D4KKN0_DREPO|nr:hypothetical protein DPMN_114759 [Dreissena polymorpha]
MTGLFTGHRSPVIDRSDTGNRRPGQVRLPVFGYYPVTSPVILRPVSSPVIDRSGQRSPVIDWSGHRILPGDISGHIMTVRSLFIDRSVNRSLTGPVTGHCSPVIARHLSPGIAEKKQKIEEKRK